MNERSLNPLNTLRGKLLIAFLVAIFVPLALAAFLGISGAMSINQENLRALLLENGTQQTAQLQASVTEATGQVRTFLSAQEYRTTLRNSMLPPAPELANRVVRLRDGREMLQTLIDTHPELVAGGWVLPEGANHTDVFVANDDGIYADRDMQSLAQDVLGVVRADNLQTETAYRLIGGIYEENPFIALVSPLVSGAGSAAQRVGYVVVVLDIEEVVFDALTFNAASLAPSLSVSLPNEVYVDSNGGVLAQPPVEIDGSLPIDSVTLTELTSGSSALIYYDRIATDLGDGLTLILSLETTFAQQQVFTYVGQVGFPVIVGAIVLLFILFQVFDQMITPPLLQIVEAMRGVVRGYYDVPLPSQRRDDEIGTLSYAFAEMRDKIKNLTQEMEDRLQARMRDVQVTQNITRTITSERDLQYLMNRVVNLIIENFPQIYHAQIFLLDANAEHAVLRASTGEAGQNLLQRGHKLRVGSISVIGQVVELGERNLARDTARSNVHRQNEFLPHTRAELAVPLRLGNRIIGALDVQSRERNSFHEDLINTLETLADQISVAIENARLYEQSAQLLADLQRQRRSTAQQSWDDYLRVNRVRVQMQQSGISTETNFEALTLAATLSRKSVVGSATEHNTVPFVVPIVLNDTTLGTVEYEVPQAEFSYNKVLLAEELVNRLSISLENARLFQESQQTAERERIVNDIAAKLALENEVQGILQTALREVGQALRTPHVSIQLDVMSSEKHNGTGNGSNGHNGSNGSHPALDE